VKGYLVWKDGTRVETEFVGAQRIHFPHNIDGVGWGVE
jgi:hypothetical protein